MVVDDLSSSWIPFKKDDITLLASLVTQWKKIPLPVQEMQVQSLGWEDPPEKEMALLQYSCLGNPMDRGAWRKQSWGHKRIGHGVTKQQQW